MKKTFFYAALAAVMTMGLTSCFNVNDDNPAPSTTDDRISEVIPDELRETVEEFIPIYDGVTPPVVEGAYYLAPQILVKSTLEWDTPGSYYLSEYQQFSNQNMINNTIDMIRVQGGGREWMKGSGAFISGSGNNFTISFNMEGEASGIYVKEGIVVSGTKTSAGIVNLSWAFVLTEKGDDPNGRVVPVGTIRSFTDEDGLSESVEWPYEGQYAPRRGVAPLQLPFAHQAK